MTEDMQVRNLSSQTQATYLQQVSLFARHFNKSPEILGPEEIRSYQVYLTNERKLAPSSIIIAVAALRFLYKITLHKDWDLAEVIPTPKKPQKLPIVLSPEEVLKFLASVRSLKHRTILPRGAVVQKNLKTAKSAKVRLVNRRAFLKAIGSAALAFIDGEEEGFAALYTRKGTGEIVGATLVAAHAGEMISELTLAITNKLPMKALAETVHCYPTQAEVF